MEKRSLRWLKKYIDSLLPKNVESRICVTGLFCPHTIPLEISFWTKKMSKSYPIQCTPAIPLWAYQFKKPLIKKVVAAGVEHLKGNAEKALEIYKSIKS